MLCWAIEKFVPIYIPTSKVIRSCSYELISLKTFNAVQSSISNEMKIYINKMRVKGEFIEI